MPVASRDDEFERVEEGVDRLGDLVPFPNGQCPARTEVVLEIDDEKRVHRASVESKTGPLARPAP
jgi:hypothetical protein